MDDVRRTELLAALEAATGPSRELDRRIAKEIGWFRVEPRFTVNKKGGWIHPRDFCGTDGDGRPLLDSLHGTDIWPDVPAFSSSIDAALSVLPDGADWSRYRAANMKMTMMVMTDSPMAHMGQAATPALALVIAAIRARGEG